MKLNLNQSRLAFIILQLILSGQAIGQSKEITGLVTAKSDKLSLPGVNVTVQGTTKGTSTDAGGQFKIQIEGSENILVFTYIGYQSKSIEIGSQNVIQVELDWYPM